MVRPFANACSKNPAQRSSHATTHPAKRAHDSDDQLVLRARRGDKQAFTQLFKKYRGRLGRLLLYVIRDATEVEDLTQEAFIKAYVGLPAFRGESAFYTWLYRIGINVARNHLAAAKRRAPANGKVDIENAERDEEAVQLHDLGNPEDIVHAEEIAHAFDSAASDLSPELRIALDMCEVDSMSYRDIARRVGCPVGTVRSRIFRAREAIAARLRPMLDVGSQRIW